MLRQLFFVVLAVVAAWLAPRVMGQVKSDRLRAQHQVAALVSDEKDDEPDRKKGKKKKPDKKKDGKKDDKKEEKEEKKEFADLDDLNAEVNVLQVIHGLDLKTGQLKALAALAATTAQKPPPRKKVLATEKYRKALIAMRLAFISNNDEKITEAFDALEALRDRESPEFDEVKITEEARKEVPAVFRKLSARQLLLFLSTQVDDFPDPTERLLEGLKASRKLRGKEWLALRDDTAHVAGWLIGGLDTTKEAQVRDKVVALLNKAASLNDEDYDEQAAGLRKSARELVGKLSPTTVIRHYVERSLAEALSNYRLAAVVQARLKK
jgi:hypothetical protein